jgi:hypothetical protein
MTDQHDDDTGEQYLEARMEEAWTGEPVDPHKEGKIACPCCGNTKLHLTRLQIQNPSERVYMIECDGGVGFSEIDGGRGDAPSVTLCLDCEVCGQLVSSHLYLALTLEDGRTLIRWG